MRSEFVSEESHILRYKTVPLIIMVVLRHSYERPPFHGTEGASADAESWTTPILLLHLEE
jgi:hypothetical protein